MLLWSDPMLAFELDYDHVRCCSDFMNILDLTPQQLKRAASIKEQIDALNRELRQLSRWLYD